MRLSTNALLVGRKSEKKRGKTVSIFILFARAKLIPFCFTSRITAMLYAFDVAIGQTGRTLKNA